MRKKKIKTPIQEPLVGELITGPQEYTLLKPIVLNGVPRAVGEKVKLKDHQAERLKRSEHI